MNRWMLAVVFLLVFGIALAACSDSASDSSFGNGGPCPGKTPPVAQDDVDMTVEQLVDLVAEAITCPGYAFHMQGGGQFEAGPYTSEFAVEVWTDVLQNRARLRTRNTFNSDEARDEAEASGAELQRLTGTEIIRHDGHYTKEGHETEEDAARPARKDGPPTCHGAGKEAIAALIRCRGLLDTFGARVEVSTSYRGQPAVAIVSEGAGGSGETYYLSTRIFFATDSYLPVGQTVEGTIDVSEVHLVEADIPYQHEFVPLESLPADFFDPASIGYQESES